VTQTLCKNDGGKGTSDLKLDAIFKHIFLCHLGIHSSTFPGFYDFRFTPVHQDIKEPPSLLFGRQDTLGLWKNAKKV